MGLSNDNHQKPRSLMLHTLGKLKKLSLSSTRSLWANSMLPWRCTSKGRFFGMSLDNLRDSVVSLALLPCSHAQWQQPLFFFVFADFATFFDSSGFAAGLVV